MSTEEGTAGSGPDRDRLAGALETVFEVLAGERLEAAREMVSELDHRLSGRITSSDERSTTEIESVKGHLTTRLDEAFAKLDEAFGRMDELLKKFDEISERLGEADRRQQSSLEQLEKRLGDSTADLDHRLEEWESRTEDRIRAVKEEMGSSLASTEEQINKELDTLGRNLSGIQLEFGQQTRATERMSIVLDGLANVLKGDPAPPPAPNVGTAADADPTGKVLTVDPSPAPNSDVSDEILDNALERVFSKDQT
jgi:hypothetical protein